MSGERKSLDERKNDLEVELDRYTQELSLSNIHPRNEIESYLTYSRDDLRSLSSEDCGEIAYMLSQYALYLQKECGRHTAILSWAETNLDYLIGKNIDNYADKFTNFTERRLRTIAGNDAARKFQQFMVEAKKRIDVVSFLSTRVETMVKCMIELQQTKRRNNG